MFMFFTHRGTVLLHGHGQNILAEMQTQCDAIILGCTELSLAQEWAPDHDFPVVDSQSVLVDRSIELGLKLREK